MTDDPLIDANCMYIPVIRANLFHEEITTNADMADRLVP